MLPIDLTNIILGLLTFLNGIGWFFDRHKHKQEVEGLKYDNQKKEMDLAKEYVNEFKKNIVEPLRKDMDKLTNKVNELDYAIQKIQDCPVSSDCPVRKQLRKQQKSGQPLDGGQKPDDGGEEPEGQRGGSGA